MTKISIFLGRRTAVFSRQHFLRIATEVIADNADRVLLVCKRSAVCLMAVIWIALLSGAAISQEIVKKEPPSGAIKHGQVVLVDDGTCPPGQIKQVTGGKRDGSRDIKRIRRCVPKK